MVPIRKISTPPTSSRCGCTRMRTGQLFTIECSARVRPILSNSPQTEMTERMTKTFRKTPSQRQPYARPLIKEFGSVGTLTQSGSGVDQEPMTGMGMMNPAQRP